MKTIIYSTKNLAPFYQDIDNGCLDSKDRGVLGIFKFMVLADEIIFWDHSQDDVHSHKEGIQKYCEQQNIKPSKQHGGGEISLSTKNGRRTLTFKGTSLSFDEPEELLFKILFAHFQNELRKKGIDAEYSKEYERIWERRKEAKIVQYKKGIKLAFLFLLLGAAIFTYIAISS